MSVDDDEVDGVGDGEVDGVGDKVGGVNTSVQCVDLMLEVIPGPQWTLPSVLSISGPLPAMGAYGRQVVVIQHTHYDEEQP